MICPLCASEESNLFEQDKQRSFYQCRQCSLVFVPRNELISVSAEKTRYESHENDEQDPGYRAYLSRIAQNISKYLNKGMPGLDFGSGKTKVLAELLKDQHVDSYDVFFHPHEEVKNKKYDFIVLSEVIEHLRDPRRELLQLKKMLNEKGLLFIKTKLLPESGFQTWFYKRDITHVQFFSDESFRFLSSEFSLSIPEKIGEDLFLFRNNG